MSFQVGDPLWFVPSHRLGGEPREEIVARVSKLWVHTDRGHKFRPDSMCVQYGKYYRSTEEYEADERCRWAWNCLIKVLCKTKWLRPNLVTADDVYAAASLLRLPILCDERKRG